MNFGKAISHASLGVTLLLLSQCHPARNPNFDEVDALFSGWDTKGSPGCAVLIYQNGEVVYDRTFGMADIADSVPIRSSTPFHVASLTKQFTGMAIAILEERGLIDKKEAVTTYVAELPDYGASIRIQHLLEHTSGIPEYQYLGDLIGLGGREGVPKKLFFELLQNKRTLNNPPGQRYVYSNSNYVLLALIVEEVTGMEFSAFVQKELFDPLQMHSSRFVSDIDQEEQERLARGYNQAYEVEEPRVGINTVTGDGGIVTTMEDLHRWVQSLIAMKSPESKRLMKRPVGGHYAYGLQHFHHYELPTVSHGGVHYGFRSNVLVFPEQDFYVIILGNIDDRDFFYNNYVIADLFLQDHYKELTTQATPIDDAERFTGEFTNPYFDEVIHVSATDTALHVRNYQNGATDVVFQREEGLFESATSSGRKSYAFSAQGDSIHVTDYTGAVMSYAKAAPFRIESWLPGLAGTYRSTDVGFTLHLTIDEGGTLMSDLDSDYFNNFRPLTSTVWMNANIPMMTLAFQQEEGRPAGFSLSTDRLKRLEFEKVE